MSVVISFIFYKQVNDSYNSYRTDRGTLVTHGSSAGYLRIRPEFWSLKPSQGIHTAQLSL
jgi:hypothetical protein